MKNIKDVEIIHWSIKHESLINYAHVKYKECKKTGIFKTKDEWVQKEVECNGSNWFDKNQLQIKTEISNYLNGLIFLELKKKTYGAKK